MAYGIEVFDENRNLVFDAGRRYMKTVGKYQVPAANRVPFSGLNYSFDLPSSVPENVSAFAFGQLDRPPAAIIINGRRVDVQRHGTLQGSSNLYNARDCVVIFGYYA